MTMTNIAKCTLIATVLAATFPMACTSSRPSNPASALVGKWQTYEKVWQATSVLEFFPSGDFSRVGGDGTSAGKYTLVDAKHVKLDYGMEAEIYEIVSLSDTEMQLKQGTELVKWTRVK